MYQGKMLHLSQASEISPPLAQLSLTCDFRHRNLKTPRASSQSEGHPGITALFSSISLLNRLIVSLPFAGVLHGALAHTSPASGVRQNYARREGRGNRLMLSRASIILMCHK